MLTDSETKENTVTRMIVQRFQNKRNDLRSNRKRASCRSRSGFCSGDHPLQPRERPVRHQFNKEVSLMELLADEAEDEHGIPDDGELSGSGDFEG
jgi:hypothetical protein